MTVEDYMQVVGRGWVLIVYGDELKSMPIHVGEKIVQGDTTFTIEGVERSKYDTWWNNRAALILNPNLRVPICFEIGDEVEIIK